MEFLRRHVHLHLYQSRYALDFLVEHQIATAEPLSDYLATEYLSAAAGPRANIREDIVAYNPAKGKHSTESILKCLASRGDSIRPVPIMNMTRVEVLDLLGRSKVYIDFGNHPGKDRIPREAAAAGCCVVVNQRGSAGNNCDILIPAEYKINDKQAGYAAKAADKIADICSDFERHSKQFDLYRSVILSEPDRFRQDALRVFKTV